MYVLFYLTFDIHKAVHRNIISIVKPTRCTNVSNLFYFGMTLYMFRTVFSPIIRIQILSNRYCCLLASKQQYLFGKCLLLYVQFWTPDDGRNDRLKHVECHSKIKEICYNGASSWFYYRNCTILYFSLWPASWSSGQGLWLLIMSSRVRFPVLLWEFFLAGKDSRGDHGLGS